MTTLTQSDSRFLNELVKDCITYKLDFHEAQEYIRVRSGRLVSTSAYQVRKAKILSDESTKIWLNHFTRIGFVKKHQQDIEIIRKLRDDSVRQLLVETLKPQRDEFKILRLKHDIRDNTQLLSELNLGTPIISAIKAKIQQKENDNNTKAIQVSV